MEDRVNVTLVANAGLLLSFGGIVLAVDCVYGREGHPFSNLTPEVWGAMLYGEHPFEKIDYLLFTHAHPDHFSPEMTELFLRRRRVKGVFFPDGPDAAAKKFRSYLTGSGIPAVPLSSATDQALFRIEPGISVCAFGARHLDKKYWNVPHFCYVLTFGDKKLLLTADADYTSETFENLESLRFRAVFLNPLFFGALRCGRFFRGHLNTEEYCVYHVPFEADDRFRMRARLKRDLALWPPSNPSAAALCEPFQSVEM